MKKILLFGGGTGLSNLLGTLIDDDYEIEVVVTVADNGGSTGKIRSYYDIPAPGDLRKVISSIIKDDELKQITEYRFDNKIQNHTVGNLILTGLVDICGDMSSAVNKYCEMFQINTKIYPLSNESVHLYGKTKDGKIIKGENQITKSKEKVVEIFYENDIIPSKNIINSIHKSDYIIYAPGSLYTSLLPNLVIKEIKEALQNTSAKKIYISNIMTQKGETDGYKLSNHINAIKKHTYENVIDIVVANSYYNISDQLKEKYNKNKSELVICDEENIENIVIYKEKLINEGKYIRHNIQKVKEILKKVIGESDDKNINKFKNS